MALVGELIFDAPQDDYPRTRAEIDAYPYAQMGVVYDELRPGIAILAEYVDGNHHWVASDAFSLLMSPYGRILQLRANGQQWVSPILIGDPLATDSDSDELETTYVRPFFSGRVGQTHQLKLDLRCKLIFEESESIEIKRQRVETNRWRERCQAPNGEFTEQIIWLDSKQRMFRLTGKPGPGAKSVVLEILKVPG